MNKLNKFSKSDFRRFAVLLFLIVGFVPAFFTRATSQTKKTREIVKLTPVVLIHGIGGSNLERKRGREGDAGERSLISGFPHDVLKALGEPLNLQLTEYGEPLSVVSGEMRATGFYDVPLSRDITDLSKYLQAQGYQKNVNLFEFYYDFRFSIPRTAELLSEVIDRVKVQTGSPRVDLVGHSMGGIVVKQYLLKPENADNVRTIVFAAVPHLGAPKALKALRYGDNLDVGIFDKCKLKRAVHNMPSMFSLLPGKRYFQMSGSGYFDDADDLDDDQTSGLLDYEHTLFNLQNGRETKCLLKKDDEQFNDAPPYDKLSSILIKQNVEDFRERQDNWIKPPKINVFVISGYNVPTLRGIQEKSSKVTFTFTPEGDGTVPLWSAETCDADQIYYADFNQLKTDHSEMIGQPQIDWQIYKLLQSGAGIYAEAITTKRPAAAQFISVTRFVTEKPVPIRRSKKRGR